MLEAPPLNVEHVNIGVGGHVTLPFVCHVFSSLPVCWAGRKVYRARGNTLVTDLELLLLQSNLAASVLITLLT